MGINVTPIPRLIDLATPAFTLGVTNTAGAASTAVSSNSTLLAFDTTVPTTIAYSDSAATGSAVVSSRRDHTHGMAASGATTEATKAQVEAQTAAAVYVPPDLLINSPGVSVAWAKVAADGSDTYLQHNVSGLAKTSTGNYTITFDVDMSDNGYAVVLSCSNTATAFFTSTHVAVVGSVKATIQNASETDTDQQFGLIVMGDL